MTDTPIVRDDRSERRFVLEVDGGTAQLVYDLEPGRLILVHTEVPAALRGRGIGGQLVSAAARAASAEGLVVLPWCSFARRWLHEHPDVAAGVTIDPETPPPQP